MLSVPKLCLAAFVASNSIVVVVASERLVIVNGIVLTPDAIAALVVSDLEDRSVDLVSFGEQPFTVVRTKSDLTERKRMWCRSIKEATVVGFACRSIKYATVVGFACRSIKDATVVGFACH